MKTARHSGEGHNPVVNKNRHSREGGNPVTENLDLWSSTYINKSTAGRGSNGKHEAYGIKKLRELILELAMQGKLVSQDPNDEPANILLEKIAKEKAELIKEGRIKKKISLPEICNADKSHELPQGWGWARFGSVYELEYGNNLPKEKRSNSGEYPVYGSNGIVGTNNTCCIDKPCIVVGRKGSAGALNLCMNEGCWITDVAYSVVPPSLMDIEFTFKLFHTLGLEELGKGIKPGLSRNEAYILPIVIPPLKEQHRIVAKVDELMALCDQLEQKQTDSLKAHQTLVETLLDTLIAKDGEYAGNAGAIFGHQQQNEFEEAWQRIAEHFDTLFTTEHSIDQIKQTIFQLAVMGKLVPQTPDDEPASVLLEKIVNEKAQLIADKKIKKNRSTDTIISENCNWKCPQSWSVSELQDIFKFIDYRGKNPQKSDTGKRLITAKNIRMGFIKNEPVEYISEELYKTWMVRGFPQNGDILFVTEGHTMGFVTLTELEYEFALAQRTICFQPYIKFNTKYFLYALMSQQFQNIVRDNQTGSAAGGIKASKLKRVPIPVPPLTEQHRIVAKVDELMALCDTLKARITDAQSTQVHLADAIVEQAVA